MQQMAGLGLGRNRHSSPNDTARPASAGSAETETGIWVLATTERKLIQRMQRICSASGGNLGRAGGVEVELPCLVSGES